MADLRADQASRPEIGSVLDKVRVRVRFTGNAWTTAENRRILVFSYFGFMCVLNLRLRTRRSSVMEKLKSCT